VFPSGIANGNPVSRIALSFWSGRGRDRKQVPPNDGLPLQL
jgi:hypothetical protein